MNNVAVVEKQFLEARARLAEILKETKTPIVRDAAIKRFELAFDLAWKLVKVRLEIEKGIICRSPKDCFRLAYQNKMVEYDNFWLEMTDWRNRTAHTYREKLADEIFLLLPKMLVHFEML